MMPGFYPLAAFFEVILLRLALLELRSNDRGQRRQRYFRAARYRQVGREAPAGNAGEQRIALKMDDFRIGSDKTPAWRFPWHIGIDEKKHIGFFGMLNRLHSEVERMIGGKIEVTHLLHHR